MGVLKLLVLALLLMCILSTCVEADRYVIPPARLAPSPYPEWAHYHWLAAWALVL